MFLLLLTVAGIASEHSVTALDFHYPQYMSYTENSQLIVCTGGQFVFGYDGGAGTGNISATKCVVDVIFKGGFEAH